MSFLKKFRLVGWSLLSGLSLVAAWPPYGFSPLILIIGLMPLFFIEAQLSKSPDPQHIWKLLGSIYLAFVVWNAGTTWWVWNASGGGAVMAILINALLMSIPFLLYHITKKAVSQRLAYIAFLSYWLGFEYLHHEWELAWPWLTLGNVFAKQYTLIQWYEYTGVLGGSLWVLVCNRSCFNLLFKYQENKQLLQAKQISKSDRTIRTVFQSLKLAATLFLPMLWSLLLQPSDAPNTQQLSVVIAQPSMDASTLRPGESMADKQVNVLIQLSQSKLSPTTDYLVWPESALYGRLWMEDIEQHPSIKKVRQFLSQYPNLTLISGISINQALDSLSESPTARHYRNGDCCYDAFNSALQMTANGPITYYHKSKLVPGVERTPYHFFLRFLDPLADAMGGISGSLGTQEERTNFLNRDSLAIAPVICFESVFGDYLTTYVQNGAQALFIMTDDGWWGNTLGYRQHLHYASLRAIENRIAIARSANTGVSCFITPDGAIHQATEFETAVAIKGEIPLHQEKTFFSQHGDYIGRSAAFIAIFFLLLTFVSNRTERFKYRRK